VTAPSNVTRIHAHRCAYVLRLRNHSICVSQCHYGQVVSRIYKDGAA
jgi:hypothetical protein